MLHAPDVPSCACREHQKVVQDILISMEERDKRMEERDKRHEAATERVTRHPAQPYCTSLSIA